MAKSLEEHFGYLSDTIKVQRYRAAMDKAVSSGDVTIDLGCGSGLLGLMALEAGAGKVIFVEEGDVIELARRTVADAGFAGKAMFFKENSFQLALPEKADVVVCDHIGYFGFDYGVLDLLADARERFLKPDGIVVPSRVDLKLAPIESETCRALVDNWRDGSVPEDFSWVAATSANTKHGPKLESRDLLAAPAALGSLQLGDESSPFLSFSAEFEVVRDGLLDGLAGFFDCELVDGIHMTNSPLAEDCINRPQAYLPLETSVPVRKGDRIAATIMLRPSDHVIAWVVEHPESGSRFEHTTFNGLLLDRETLSRAQPNRVAKLNRRGEALQIVLSYCDGARTVADVQALVQRQYPDLFPSEQALSRFIRQTLAWVTSE